MSNHIGGPGVPGGPPEENGKLWIRDNTGAALEISDVWIREEGQLKKIDKIWIRNNSYAQATTIHYDNLPEPTGGTYNAQAFAKGHKRWAFVPPSAGDPNNTGTINDTNVLNHISNISWLSDIEYGILDFETPYSSWLAEGVTGPPTDNYYQALTEMIDLIQKVKAQFPQIKWAFYVVPNVRFFIFNNTWLGLEQTNQYDPINQRLDGYVNAYGPLIDEQDFICPQIMDRYVYPERSEQNKRWVHYSIEAGKRHNVTRNQDKPIVANMCPMYQYANDVIESGYLPIFIDNDETRDETIHPALENGASNNFLLWTGHTFWIPSVFDLATYPLDYTILPADEQLMGYRINRYREAYTQDFFNGVAPDWNSAADEQTLRQAVCERMIQYMDDIKEITIQKTKDNAPELVYEI